VDLPRRWDARELEAGPEHVIEVSALTGDGLGRLRRRIVAALVDREELRDPPAISNVRHLALVDRAREHVTRAEAALNAGATEELVLTDLVAARRALEEITGRRTTDELLAHIFGKFCVGK
jgi:tRNA modification GTPase